MKRFFGRAKIGTFDAEVRQSMWFSNTGNFLSAPRLGGPQSRAVGWRTEDVESRIDGLATNGHGSVVQSGSSTDGASAKSDVHPLLVLLSTLYRKRLKSRTVVAA